MSRVLLATLKGVQVWKEENPSSIVFTAGLAINADGSPRAYAPAGLPALDHLANAGSPNNWWGLATDGNGKPFVQTSSDPCPDFFVSTTSLQDPHYPAHDPRRYTNSETVPFVVLPPQALRAWGVKLGARCTVRNLENGKTTSAIFADVGPRDSIGEGSIALAVALGIPSNPRTGGTSRPIVEYRITLN